MTHSEFYVGQRVKQWDTEEGYNCYGRVKEVKEKSVIVDWDDPNWGLMENIEHFEDEFATIKDGNPPQSPMKIGH